MCGYALLSWDVMDYMDILGFDFSDFIFSSSVSFPATLCTMGILSFVIRAVAALYLALFLTGKLALITLKL